MLSSFHFKIIATNALNYDLACYPIAVNAQRKNFKMRKLSPFVLSIKLDFYCMQVFPRASITSDLIGYLRRNVSQRVKFIVVEQCECTTCDILHISAIPLTAMNHTVGCKF